MVHEYSVQAHDFITEKIQTVEEAIVQAQKSGNSDDESYYKGMLEEFRFVRQFIDRKSVV